MFLCKRQISYRCELVALCEGMGVLRYVVDTPQKVGSLTIEPGTVSYGFYWQNRPYVLYKWYDREGRLLGDYFNVADSVKMSKKEISWRDLIVDVLVLPTGETEVLDEEELPSSLPSHLAAYILSAKEMVLEQHEHIAAMTAALVDQYDCVK